MTKLTPERHTIIVEMLKAGARVPAACNDANVSDRVHYVWMDRGRREHERLENDDQAEPIEAEERYLRYFRDVQKAQTRSEMANLARIQQAARGGEEVQRQEIEKFDAKGRLVERRVVSSKAAPQWTAAAWFLERRYPAEYGRRDTLKLEAELQAQLQVLFADLREQLSPEAYAELESVVNERTGAGGAEKLSS